MYIINIVLTNLSRMLPINIRHQTVQFLLCKAKAQIFHVDLCIRLVKLIVSLW